MQKYNFSPLQFPFYIVEVKCDYTTQRLSDLFVYFL